MVVMPAGFPRLEIKHIEFHDGLLGKPGKNTASAVANGFEVAGRREHLDFHASSIAY